MLLGVDVGGTFTDAVLAFDGRIVTAKAPTTPDDQSEGVIAAVDGGARARRARGRTRSSRSRHGMTVATNALLEGRGARTALIATEGFTDLVALGRQNRAELYRLCAPRPAPLVPARAALRRARADDARHGAAARLRGGRRRAGQRTSPPRAPRRSRSCCCTPTAIPSTSARSARRSRDALPDVHVSLSHEVVGTFREFERAATTEVDAALSPLLAGYLRALRRAAAPSAGSPSRRSCSPTAA